MENLLNKIHFADCLDILRQLPDGSVDLLLQDPPYNTTDLHFEYDLNFPVLWAEWQRVAKSNAAFVFTASNPFAAELIISKKDLFKYEWVWEKGKATLQTMVAFRPLKAHELILVFGKAGTYNPQKEKGAPYKGRNCVSKKNGWEGFGNFKGKDNDGFRHPRSVIREKSGDRDGALHPTQKPTDLFRYLIRTYSNPGDVVFDGYGGSGTTAIAAQMEGRRFIVCENHLPYFEASQARLSNLVAAPYLFSDCG